MSIFKRLSATVFSRVDQVVSGIENHDAIIDASLRDHEHALAQAKVRLTRLRADGRRLEQRLANLRDAQSRWTSRAREVAARDEQTALRCLQRRRESDQQITQVEAMLAEHTAAEQRLVRDLEGMQGRLAEIRHQRNLLRTRQSSADAMRTLRAIASDTSPDIDNTFEKWEVKVTEAELASGQFELVDELDRQFIEEEERIELKAELEELIHGEKS